MPDILADPTLSVNEALRKYFLYGLSFQKIQEMLIRYHGTELSISALKKRRQRLGIRKRRGPPQHGLQEIEDAILNLLPFVPSTAGYRNLTETLRYHGFDVRRETVRQILLRVDPEGVAQRRRRRMRRKVYLSPGPNYCWHLDGYDKLKPYGFAIHGCIDGYSRRIMWLQVDPSNNNPHAIAKYYMDCVQQCQGCPTLVTSDPGTENGVVAALQSLFRQNQDDNLAGNLSHRYVKSTSNQRIEAWWSFFRRDRMEWWINFFRDMHESGVFNKDNENHRLCIRFCFMPVIKQELAEAAERWNRHYITDSPAARCPPGQPNVLYSLGANYMCHVSQENIEFGFTQSIHQTRSGNADFDEYAGMILGGVFQEEPSDPEDALEHFEYLVEQAVDPADN